MLSSLRIRMPHLSNTLYNHVSPKQYILLANSLNYIIQPPKTSSSIITSKSSVSETEYHFSPIQQFTIIVLTIQQTVTIGHKFSSFSGCQLVQFIVHLHNPLSFSLNCQLHTKLLKQTCAAEQTAHDPTIYFPPTQNKFKINW